ncbi:MAG: tetratricopeptide repeat protein [Candidatus Kapabacteria bacterium]|nr:tetratricopeptide repeat protein [Candidatus Kapabacteria bacterium]
MITKEEANNGQAWFRLGVSLHGLSEHKEAVQPYNNAVRLGFL